MVPAYKVAINIVILLRLHYVNTLKGAFDERSARYK